MAVGFALPIPTRLLQKQIEMRVGTGEKEELNDETYQGL